MNQDDRTRTTSWDAQTVQQGATKRDKSVREAAAAPKKKKKKKVKRKMNFFLSLVLWVVFVCVASAVLAGIGWLWFNDVTALNKKPLETTVTIDESWAKLKTEKNEDGTEEEIAVYDIEKVAAELKAKGLIEYEWLFRLFSWVYNSEEKVGAGTYTLNSEMDYMALVRGMRPVTTVNKVETVTVSIPEGYNVRQIISLLAENGVCSEEALTDAAANYQFKDYAFIREDLLGSVTRLEGYLFPDTYEFYVGGNPVSALDTMLSNFTNKIYNNADLADYLADSKYDLEDIIVIASLIEKETDGSDRAKIASVIYNRLSRAAETAYFLQIDASLVYAAGREITKDDYANLDSPYNLYTHTGLPPTAIANPGLASITAALQPADTNYFFYVLGADGKHIFNETLAGHQKTLAKLG